MQTFSTLLPTGIVHMWLLELPACLIGLIWFLWMVTASFHGVPAEERLHWQSFLVKLGADNLKGAKNEELFVASHKKELVILVEPSLCNLGQLLLYQIWTRGGRHINSGIRISLPSEQLPD
ncbi:uncharacterized protein LOC143854240 [Tasmannia lanceolata]|uniref:uncharacterized protein LOC143854240 n=1 Tax=Tasmannia lanceolata TaxID=3420 RepID=UPI004062E401